MKRKTAILSLILCIAMIIPSLTVIISEITSHAEETNIALGKSAVSTQTDFGTNANAVTDGNITTYWDGGVCPSEVIVDLADFYKISKINVVTYYDGTRYYQFSVYGSDDGTHYKLIGSKADEAVSTSAGVNFTSDATFRYIKIKITKNSANPAAHVNEIRVYGTLDEDYVVDPDDDNIDPTDPSNIAYGKPTRANSNDTFSSLVVDGDLSSYWTGIDYPKYVDVDLMANYNITSVKVFMPVIPGCTYAYTMYGSLDGVNYTRLGTSELKAADVNGDTYTFSTPVNYRIIRVNVTSNSNTSGKNAMVSEIKIYGTKNDSAVTMTREKLNFTSYDQWLLDNYSVNTSLIKDESGNYDIKDTYTVTDTINAVKGLIKRILGEKYISWFTFELEDAPNGKDYYEISQNSDGTINIKGNEGVSITAGLNYFLKYNCNVQISQQTSQVNMPSLIPEIEGSVRRETPYEVRYAYNYCTLSYTMAFFGYDEWQRELDYLALNGINLILDTTATEAMWVYYLQQLGYTADEAKDFVCGYAYKAWWLMGNLENYGGSVSDQWIYDTLEMARQNERYMTILGIQPCLQGFMGMFPNNIKSKAGDVLTGMGYSDISSSLVKQGTWAGFERPIVLMPSYDGYEKLSEMFYNSQDYIYGKVTDYYCGDICHEGGVIPESTNRAEMSAKILDLMMKADKDAVWIIQAWWSNPTKETLQGYGENREDHILVLDLTSAHSNSWKNTTTYGGKEFMGTSWVFCILENYGGRTGMHGDLDLLAQNVYAALGEAEHMKGIGMTSEATQQNPVVFELFWELGWTNEKIDVTTWINKYVERRYGQSTDNIKKAWELILASVYNYETADGTSVNTALNNNPKFGTSGAYFDSQYSRRIAENALKYLIADFDILKDNENYIYDLVELMRQLISDANFDYYLKLNKANTENDYETFKEYKDLFLDTISMIDEISSYQKDSLLGTWIGRADAWVNDDKTGTYDDYSKDMIKINEKALITVWSSRSLANYAYRQYSGLVNDYYLINWTTFLDTVEQSLKDGKTCTVFPAESVYFSNAWDLVISDKEYTSQVSNASGDDNERGLKAIYDEMAEKYLLKSGLTFTGKLTDTITWTVVDDVLTISGTGAMPDFSSYSEQPWQEYQVSKVIVEDGITQIGKVAFSNISSLNEIIVGKDVTAINMDAFAYNSTLTTIKLYSSLKTLGQGVVCGSNNISTIYYVGTPEQWTEFVKNNVDSTKPGYSGKQYNTNLNKTPVYIYVVTWTFDGVSATSEVTADGIPSYSGTPVKDGYTFIGWSDGTTTHKSALPAVTGNVTYTAVFEKNAGNDPLPEPEPTPGTGDKTVCAAIVLIISLTVMSIVIKKMKVTLN